MSTVPLRTVDFQAGGSNPHYGRIAYWLAAGVAKRLADVVVNVKVWGSRFRVQGLRGTLNIEL